MASGPIRELKSMGYEIFMLLLSILSVANTVFLVIGRLVAGPGGPALEVVLIMDAVISPIFLFDFVLRLMTAPSWRRYFFREWGWADLLATLPLLRVFRIFRIVRVVRLLRAEGLDRVGAELLDRRAAATFLFTLFLVLVVLEVAGASIYYVEGADRAANITSAGDALWWGLVTITTVGYGDKFPVTGGGRVIGVFLLLAGIGIFSVLTGFIANIFLAPRRPARFVRPVDDPRATIAAVRALMVEQDERAEQIRSRLDELQRSIAKPPPSASEGRREPGG
jgi:voltage-gated potassium channel Kch